MRKIFIGLMIFFVLILSSYLYVKKVLKISPRHLKNLSSPITSEKKNLLSNEYNGPIKVADGYFLSVYSDVSYLGMPRVLEFDENGVVFVSLPKSGKVAALLDIDDDRVSDGAKIVLSGLNLPHGLAFYKNKLFVAETDKIVSYDYDPETISLSNGKKIIDLPEGGRHWSRTIKIYKEKLYISVGSSCDVCNESNKLRSAILVSDLNGENLEIFASGLRNTVFFDFDEKGQIWGSDMGRDFLGDDLPPDELNIIKKGLDYGWPYCYGDKVRDKKFRSWEPLEKCAQTQGTVYDFPAHAAPLGIEFIDSEIFSKEDQGDILVAFHGSWNSTVPKGYKIVKLKRDQDEILEMQDFITGWISDDGEIYGRPVDLKLRNDGVLFITDDKAGVIYYLTKKQ